jgi:hypothetical protein
VQPARRAQMRFPLEDLHRLFTPVARLPEPGVL